MTEKQRLLVFIGIVILAVSGVILAIVLTSGPDNPNASNDDNDAYVPPTSISSGGPSVTPVPTEDQYIPTDEFDERQKAEDQQNIADPDPSTFEAGESGEDSEYQNLASVAQSGITEWCKITPGETFEARVARMAPYFSATAEEVAKQDLDSLIYERKCDFKSTSEVEKVGDNNYLVHVTMITAYTLEETTEVGSGGMQQYTVNLSDGVIVSIK